MFRCCSLETSHPRLLPQSLKDCSINLRLFFCTAYRVIINIFLNSIYMPYTTLNCDTCKLWLQFNFHTFTRRRRGARGKGENAGPAGRAQSCRTRALFLHDRVPGASSPKQFPGTRDFFSRRILSILFSRDDCKVVEWV